MKGLKTVRKQYTDAGSKLGSKGEIHMRFIYDYIYLYIWEYTCLLMDAMFPVPKKAVIIKNTWSKETSRTNNSMFSTPGKQHNQNMVQFQYSASVISIPRIQKSTIFWCRPASADGCWRCRCLPRNQWRRAERRHGQGNSQTILPLLSHLGVI